jgi:hypothetical protein
VGRRLLAALALLIGLGCHADGANPNIPVQMGRRANTPTPLPTRETRALPRCQDPAVLLTHRATATTAGAFTLTGSVTARCEEPIDVSLFAEWPNAGATAVADLIRMTPGETRNFTHQVRGPPGTAPSGMRATWRPVDPRRA